MTLETATGLVAHDWNGLSDPFVDLYLRGLSSGAACCFIPVDILVVLSCGPGCCPWLVVLFVDGHKTRQQQRSTVKKDTLSPAFHESFIFNLAELEYTTCRLHVDM